MTEPILVADIGGTNARFAIGERSDDVITIHDAQKFRAEDFETIRDAANAYLETVGQRPQRGCFAVAGPVTDERVEFTNSPWVLDIAEIKAALCLKRFAVVNDFEALAAGVRVLKGEDFLPVKPGSGDADAPVLVIGPGTGLGQALIVPFGDRYRVVSTEGGHVAFAPRTEEELAVLQFVAKEHPRVSVERLLSGRGIVNIYRAVCAINSIQPTFAQADEITTAAISSSDSIAIRAVNLFCELIGRVAGDAVLGTGARGGIVLGGGILPKIRDVFLKSAFVDRLLDKGRMREYLEDIPVRMIITDDAALAGAASMLSETPDEY